MKIAIFSDIHGNEYSFLKAYESMKNYNVDKFFFCGDICGYYYSQNKILDILRNMENIVCLLGNHDKMFLDIMDGKVEGNFYTSKYGKSLEILSSTISKQNLRFLRSFKSEYYCKIDGLEIAMVHGTPWDSLNEYCYPDADFTKYTNLKFDYIFQGHTHYRMHKKTQNLNIINPGSIGQPRDKKLPSYVLFDTLTKELKFISIQYDITELVTEIKEHNDPIYLIEVLKRSVKCE